MEHFASDYDIEKAIAEYEGLPYLAKKDCNCWDGYERVPGTKPCAPGSCRKCDDGRKKSAAQSPDDVWQEAIAQFVFNNPETVGLDELPGPRQGLTDSAVYHINESKDKILATVKDPSNYNEVLDALAKFYGLSAGSYRAARIASQGDKPSPKAAQAVFSALAEGDEDAAIELLGHTDCPEGCETHAEGKCNHQYMSAGRTRVRYLVNTQAFKEADENPRGTGTTDHESPVKEAGFLQDALQVVPDAIHAIPHVWNEINPAGSGAVGTFLNELNPAGDGLAGDTVDAAANYFKEQADPTNHPLFSRDIGHLANWRAKHPGPEYADQWEKMKDGFISWWGSRGVEHPQQYIIGD